MFEKCSKKYKVYQEEESTKINIRESKNRHKLFVNEKIKLTVNMID